MEESSKYLIKELKEERYFKEQYKLNTIDMNDYFAYSGKGGLIPTNYTNSPRKKKKKLRKEAEKEIEKIISDRIKKLTE